MKITVVTPSIRPEGLKIVQESLAKQTLQDFEWCVEIGIPSMGHDLNAAYNRMLKRARGELIVFYDDFIKCRPTALQEFWEAYQSDPNIFWTAPLGKTLDWDKTEWDWRAYADVVPTCSHWEIDWAAAPRIALQEIGGFDEELDSMSGGDEHCWACGNVNVAFRAEIQGYTFKNLHTNPAVAFNHDEVVAHPFRKHFNPEMNARRMEEFKNGLKINYLE